MKTVAYRPRCPRSAGEARRREAARAAGARPHRRAVPAGREAARPARAERGARDRDWRIEKLRLANPDGVLTADGVWQAGGRAAHADERADGRDRHRQDAHALGYPAGIRRGTAKIEGRSRGRATPRLRLSDALGQLAVEAANGQFVKLEPGHRASCSASFRCRRCRGASRSISATSSAKGFSFDSIIGALKIDRGIAHTENFRIQGPSARIVMAGDVDLARETQKLRCA